MMFSCQEQSSSLLFTCNFHYSYYSLRIVVIFFTAIIHIPHCTAQIMHSEIAGVLLAAVIMYLRLMQNIFLWLYSMLFWHYRNVMSICLPVLPSRFLRTFLDEGKEQRLVAASCVFPTKAMLSSPPSFLICMILQVRVTSFMYTTSTCALWTERQ